MRFPHRFFASHLILINGLGRQRATLSSFLDYLAGGAGSAKLTIAAYASDLAQFAEFLEKRRVTLTGARREHVRAYIQELFSNQLDGRSVGRKLSAIRHLYRHLLLDGKIKKDPTLNIDLPKQWKVLPKALSRDEVGAMLGETKSLDEITSGTIQPGATKQGVTQKNKETVRGQALALRDRAMLELLYAGGVRVSEVADARLEDLKLEMGYILVRGKGDKERMVPLGVPAQQALQQYLKNGREAIAGMKPGSSPLLFLGAGGRRLDPSAGLAVGGEGEPGDRAPCQSAHAAALVRDAHGGERRRPSHGADYPRPLRHFDHADLYACCARPAEERVCETSSAGESEGSNL